MSKGYAIKLAPLTPFTKFIYLEYWGRKRLINKDQMRGNAEDFMNKRKNDRKQVQKYFHVSQVKYAA